MRRRSNSPFFDRRRSPRRDRRDMPMRRRRSFSRDRYEGGRRRPSPSKRFRREDDHNRHDRSPYRRGYDRDRDYDQYHNRRDGPMSYRDFIVGLSTDVTPEDAHKRYQDYVADWYGSVVKAEFEQHKDKDWMKAKYDPRTILKIIEQHKKHAEDAGKAFEEATKPGGELDIRSSDFHQGVQNPVSDKSHAFTLVLLSVTEDVEEKSAEDKVFEAPQICWSKDRVSSDLKLSLELIQKMDTEKGIITSVSLSLQETESITNQEEHEGEDKKEERNAKEGDIRKLDLLLTYLWRVHMVDYYSGHELDDKEYEAVKCRMLRPPKDQASDEETDKRMLEKLKIRVDAFWKDRIQKGDPFQQKLQTERVEKGVEEFIESHVTQLDEERWGNKLSSKMFVGKEFVIKHIRLKHGSVVDAEREKILDDVYYDNFRKGKEEEQRKRTEEQERALRFGHVGHSYHSNIRIVHQGMDGQNIYGEFGYSPGMTGQGMVPPMVPPMMGAQMGQILMPAPGAGPMGPFVLQPVPTGGMNPMDTSQGRNLESMPSGRMNNRSFGQQREYHDLDAPQNNRAVLDYGDL